MTRSKTLRLAGAVCALGIVFAATAAQAVSYTWSNPTGGSWADTAAWSGGVIASGQDNTADFSTLDISTTDTVTLDGPQTIGNLMFGDTTPNNNWVLNTGTAGPLTLSVSAGVPTITVNNQTATINAVVAGTNGLTKAGTGTLVLTASNAYSGGTMLSAGVLSVGHNNALGSGTLTMGGGTLKAGIGVVTVPNAVVVNNVAGNAFDASGLDMVFNGDLTGSGTVTKVGNWSVKFAGDNSGFTGTYVDNSTADGTWLNAPGAGSAAATWTINSGYLGANVSGTNTFSLGALSGTGGNIHNEKAGALAIFSIGALNKDTTYGGAINNGSGSVALTKVGTGTLTLAAANTYSGSTIIAQGTLQLGSRKFQYYKFHQAANGGDGYSQIGELHYYLNGVWTAATSGSGSPVNSGSGSEQYWGNGNDNKDSSGNFTKFGQSGATYDLIYNFGSRYAFNSYNWATANDSTPARNPTKWAVYGSNDGTNWTLIDDRTGATQGGPGNTYTWAGTSSANYTAFDGSQNGGAAYAYPLATQVTLPTATPVQVASGATLDLNGVTQTIASLADYGGSGGSVINSMAGTTSLLTIAPAGGSNTFSGVIAGSSAPIGLTLTGPGSQVLAGTNTYTGATTISGGTLQLGTGASGKDGSIANTSGVANSGTLVYNLAGNQTANYAISGSGGLMKLGSGTLTIGAYNTYGGPTIVAGGALVLGSQASYKYLRFTPTKTNGANGNEVQISELQYYINGTRVAANSVATTATGIWGDGAVANINDNNLATKYGAASALNAAVTFTFSSSQPFTSYNWATANDTFTAQGRNPMRWRVEASNDNANWVTLDDRTSADQAVTYTNQTWQSGWALPYSALPTATALSVAGGAIVELNGTSQQVASLSDYGGSGGSIVNSATAAASLTLTPSGSTTFSGAILGGSTLGAISLTLNGTGATTLAGSNTYTGATTLSAGTLTVNGSLAAASNVAVGSAATLAGAGTIGGNTTLSGNGVFNLSGGTIGGTLGVTGGNWNGTGTVAGAVNSTSGQFTIGSTANLIAPAGLTVSAGTLAGAGTITGSLNYISTSSSIFAGTIAGSAAGLTLANGAATLRLTGQNSYGGPTNVNAGTLVVNGSNSGAGNVTVASGATLAGSGSLSAATVTLNSGSSLAPGSSALSGSVGTLTVGGLSTPGGATFNFDLSNSLTSGNDLVQVNGPLTFSGLTTVAVNRTNNYLIGGFYPLFNYTGVLTSSSNWLTLAPGVLTLRQTSAFDYGTNTPGVVALNITGVPATLRWVGGTAGGYTNTWKMDVTANNVWKDSSNASNYFAMGDNVVFDATGGTNTTVTISGTVAPTLVTASGTSNYTLTGTGRIGGQASLTVQGPGMLTLGTSGNDYTSGTYVTGGTLALGAANALPVNGTLTLGSSSGGSGTLDLAGYNQQLGMLAVAAGATPANQIVGNSSTSQGSILTLSGTLNFGGTIQDVLGGGKQTVGLIVSSGLSTLSGTNTYSGPTTINSGATLQLGGSSALGGGVAAGNAVVNGTLDLAGNNAGVAGLTGTGSVTSAAAGMPVLTVGRGNATSTFAGTIADGSGTVALTKTGSGTLTLLANNSYTGANTINGGVLSVGTILPSGSNSPLGSGSVLVFNGGALQYTGTASIPTTIFNRNITLLAGGGTIDTGNTDGFVYMSGTVSGSGSLTKSGTRQLLLDGSNTYSGGTTVNGGVLTVANSQQLPAGSVTVSQGATMNFAPVNESYRTMSGRDFAISGTGTTGQGALVVNVATGAAFASVQIGNVSLNGDATIGAFGGSHSNGQNAGFHFSESGGAIGTLSLNNHALTFVGDAKSTSEICGVNWITGTGNIVVNSGNVGFWASQNWTGGFIVLNPGATLANMGGNTVAAPLVVNGGTLNCGSGTFALSGSVLLSGNMTLNNSFLNWTGTGTALQGNISGSGGLICSAGANTLSGSNTYSGATYLNGGVLNFGLYSLGSGTAVNFNGGTLQYAAGNTLDISNRTVTVCAGGGTIDTGPNSSIVFANPIGNNSTGGLTKAGTGMLTLSGSQTYGGATTISAGTLQLGSGGAAATLSSTSVNNSGTLAFNHNDALTFGATISGNGGLYQTGGGTLTLTGSNTFSGPTTVNSGQLVGNTDSLPSAISLANNANVTFSQTANGTYGRSVTGQGSLTKQGIGTLTVTASQNYAGPTVIAGGVLKIGPLGYTQCRFTPTKTSGANGNEVQISELQYYVNGTWVAANSVTTTATDTWSDGAVANINDNNLATKYGAGDGLNAAVTFTYNSAQPFTSYNWATANDTYTIQGRNPMRWLVQASNDNVNWVTLDDRTTADQAITYTNQTWQSAWTLPTNWALSNNFLPVSTPLSIAANSMLDLGGASQQVASLADYGTDGFGSIINSNTGNASVLTLSATGGTTTFSGGILGGGTLGTISLTMSGSGTQVLAGGNTYTGPTTISGGVLSVGVLAPGGSASGIGASGNAAANLVFNGGALQYTGSGDSTDRLFTLGASGGTLDASGTGAVVFSSTGNLAYSGTGPRTFTLTGTNTGANTLAARLNNSGTDVTSLVKKGPGTWVLTRNNTFTGNTTVNSGELDLNCATDVAISGNLVVAGGTVRALANDQLLQAVTVAGGTLDMGSGTNVVAGVTLSNGAINGTTGGLTSTSAFDMQAGSASAALSGAVVLTKSTTGTVTLSGSNSYTGGTTVNAGTLNIATADSLPTIGNLTIAGGGHVVLASGLSHAISLGGLTITSGAGGDVGQASPLVQNPGQAGSLTYGAAAPTPEPGTVELLAMAVLVGLAAWRRTAVRRRVI